MMKTAVWQSYYPWGREICRQIWTKLWLSTNFGTRLGIGLLVVGLYWDARSSLYRRLYKDNNRRLWRLFLDRKTLLCTCTFIGHQSPCPTGLARSPFNPVLGRTLVPQLLTARPQVVVFCEFSRELFLRFPPRSAHQRRLLTPTLLYCAL